MTNILNELQSSILLKLGSDSLSPKVLLCILIFVITKCPLSLDTLGRINRMLKESED